MSLFGKSNPEADFQRRRAEDAEAMFVGASIGSAEGVRDLLIDLKATTVNWREEAGRSRNRAAETEAYKRLSEVIIDELKSPEKPRRFSDPANNHCRSALLAQAHKDEVDRIHKANAGIGYKSNDVEIDELKARMSESLAEYSTGEIKSKNQTVIPSKEHVHEIERRKTISVLQEKATSDALDKKRTEDFIQERLALGIPTWRI